MDENARTLAAMLDALAQVDAPHAVFGGLLAHHYGRTRATRDVDLLVPGRSLDSLEAVIRPPGYEVRRFPYLLRMLRGGELVGDFVMAEANAVVESAFAARTPTEILGISVNVVPRGVFVALKFEAAVGSRRRSKDRVLDVHDIHGVLARGFGPQDEQIATGLAAKMFQGAVPDLASLLEDLRRGKWPRVVVVAERRALLRRDGFAILRARGLFGRT